MTNREAANVLRIMASGIELKGYSDHWVSTFREAYEMAFKALEERPQGEWIDHSEDEGYLECPICGCLTNCDGNKEELHYCWHCGADMRGGTK